MRLRQLAVAERLLEGGRGNEVDVARARAQLVSLRAELPPFESKKAAALYQLAALLGRTPGALPETVTAHSHAPQLRQAIPLGDGTALINRRPDIRPHQHALVSPTAQICHHPPPLEPTDRPRAAAPHPDISITPT